MVLRALLVTALAFVTARQGLGDEPSLGVFSSPGDPSGDGKVDLTDFGILKDEFGKAANPKGPLLRADINADNKVDLTDFGILRDNFGKAGDLSVLGSVPGDANGDNKIDLTDFGILKASFGERGQGLSADWNGDGWVSLVDFGILKNSVQPSGAAPVPEPSTFVFATLAGIGLLAMRRRR